MKAGFAGRIAAAFIDSKLTPLLIGATLATGLLALVATPREEEPQIRVPMVDVTVAWPGAETRDVETRIVEPLERALWGLAGVEHVYAIARPGVALITARFRVNEANEESLVKVFERQTALFAASLPPGVLPPIVELRSIDDVPFLALTLSSAKLGSDEIRGLATEVARELSQIPDTTKATVTGGAPRVVRVIPDIGRMNAKGITWRTLTLGLGSYGARATGGTLVRGNQEIRVTSGPSFERAADVSGVVLAVRSGRPVYVRDIATVVDGPDEATDAVFFVTGSHGATADRPAGTTDAAVTIAIAKRPGANATAVSGQVLAKLGALRPRLLPRDVHVDVTRNYGETAEEKSNELIHHLLLATLSVVVLISLAMGWRSGLVVGIAVPVTLALTLLIYYLAGYTLNRVTLFALIFSTGILVDDAIVVVESIERHLREKAGRPFLRSILEAVDEIGNPTILATFTVIAAILPMAFVRGLMGPYMRPIPNGASTAMIFSLAVAFIVSPWAAYRVFRRHQNEARVSEPGEGFGTQLYRRMMTALVTRPSARRAFLGVVVVLLIGAIGLIPAGFVRVKMLPLDNKNEFQVLIDHEPGTPLEATLETAREMSRYLASVSDVANIQIYAGAPAPFNFNGLVRHYFLRRSSNGADLQVNLADKSKRVAKTHDLAKRVRGPLTEIARRRGARVKIIEIPPGPPVLDTLVAEIYGPTVEGREALGRQVREIFETTAGVVDVDDSLDAPRPRVDTTLDREKAQLLGVSPVDAVEALTGPGEGREVARLDSSTSREPVPVLVRLSAIDRADVAKRLSLRLDGTGGAVALDDLTRVTRPIEDQPAFHKDLRPVAYVFGDLAGEQESPVYALAALNRRLDTLKRPDGTAVERYAVDPPETTDLTAIKWDGEWQITYEVFRDLGIAFAVVLVLIAVLVIGWFRSFAVPLAILLPIPLSLVGILPGHWAFGAFFTATSMIGFIAGAGIIVRNSIMLVDFIELNLRRGIPLEDAVIEAGVVRFRPMLLTAAAVVAGSSVMLFDPGFDGLAISLMMGEIAATVLSRLAVPVAYYLIARSGRAKELNREASAANAAIATNSLPAPA